MRHLIYGVVLGLCNSTVMNIGRFYLQHHKIDKSFNTLHCASFIHNFFLFLFFCVFDHTYLFAILKTKFKSVGWCFWLELQVHLKLNFVILFLFLFLCVFDHASLQSRRPNLTIIFIFHINFENQLIFCYNSHITYFN